MRSFRTKIFEVIMVNALNLTDAKIRPRRFE